MFGLELDYNYSLQRHAELVQAAERERLIRCLEAAQLADRSQPPWRKRSLATAGGVLVWIGNWLQQAAQETAGS